MSQSLEFGRVEHTLVSNLEDGHGDAAQLGLVVEFELSSPRTSFGRSTGMSRSGRIWSFRSLAVQQRGTRGFLGVYFFG
jgi:hypothetical protein